MTQKEIKEYKDKARNQTLAGHEVQKLKEGYMLKYKVTDTEAEKLVRNEHPDLWTSYMTGSPLPKGETSKIYNL